jgi:hypothetical protein
MQETDSFFTATHYVWHKSSILILYLRTEKNSENALFPENVGIKQPMLTSESSPKELSNEWSCQ